MTTTGKGPHWISSVFDLKDVPTPDLIDAMHELRASVEAIEHQLGASKEFELEAAKENVPLPNEQRWRKSAKIALRMKVSDIGRIKDELRKREHPDYNRARDHRRAIEILADLVEAIENGEVYTNDRVDVLVAEARELLAVRNGQ